MINICFLFSSVMLLVVNKYFFIDTEYNNNTIFNIQRTEFML